MSFWLGCAMSLFGRAQDRLTHVLVNEPFEICGKFFFKPCEPQMVEITGADPSGWWARGQLVSTADARITLGYVPFPQLRPLLAGSHWLDQSRPLDVGRLIEDYNLSEAGPNLVFDDENRTIGLGDGRALPIRSARQYALYRLCAEVAANQIAAGARPARAGMITIEDFVDDSHWAAKRLRDLLSELGDETLLVDHLEDLIAWQPADARLWRELTSAQDEWRSARREFIAAERAVERAQTKLNAARNAHATRIGKTPELLAEERRRVDTAQKSLETIEAQQQAANRRRGESERRMAELTAEGAPQLRAEIDRVVTDLQQVRKRLDALIETQIEDFDLCQRLKLLKGDKPFATGLQPRLRDPGRIAFRQ